MMYEGTDVQTLGAYLRDPTWVAAGAYVIGVRGEGRREFEPYYVGQSPRSVYRRVWQFLRDVEFGDHQVPDACELRSGRGFRARGFTWAYRKSKPHPERHLLDAAARAALEPHIRAFRSMLHVFVVPVVTTSSTPDAEQAVQLERTLAAAFPGQIGRVARPTCALDVRVGAGAEHLQTALNTLRPTFTKETP